MEVPVKQIIDDELRRLGFTPHRKAVWYRERGSVLHVAGLQKSSWGRNYYLNLAIWINNPSEPTQYPSPSECHIQCRIDSVPGTPVDLDGALTEEDYWRMDAAQRREIIRLALCNADFCFFREIDSVERARIFVSKKPFSQIAIHRRFYELPENNITPVE